MANPGQEVLPPLPPDQEKPLFDSPRIPPKDQESIIKYRGSRMYMENLPLEIVDTRCMWLDESENIVVVEVFFNQSINPRSLRYESIAVNDEILPEETRFSFNRKGDTIKLVLFVPDDIFKLTVRGIKSYDGTPIEPVEIEVQVEALESEEDSEQNETVQEEEEDEDSDS